MSLTVGAPTSGPKASGPRGQEPGSDTLEELTEEILLAPSHAALWIRAGVPHTLRMFGRVEMHSLYLPPAQPCTAVSRSPDAETPRASDDSTPRVQSLRVSPLLHELILRATQIGVLERDDPEHHALATLVEASIRRAERLATELRMPRDARAYRAAEALLRRPRLDTALERVAADAGASLRTLERIFPRETGLSLGRWRRRAILLDALRRLATADSTAPPSMETLAFDSGYQTASAFVVAFRRELGKPPGTLLQELRRTAPSPR